MTSIGTLFAFMLVCDRRVGDARQGAGDDAAVPRAGGAVRVDLGVLVCGAMIFGLGWTNWTRLGVWLVIGLVVYFAYG